MARPAAGARRACPSASIVIDVVALVVFVGVVGLSAKA
jgi:hypothetical protein